MESEKRDRSEIEYVERRVSGVLELRGYKAVVSSKDLGSFDRLYSGSQLVQRAIILPLPPDFDFTDIQLNPNHPSPNGIMIVEEEGRVRHPGKKRWRPERVFLKKGDAQVRIVSMKDGSKFGPRSLVWISKEKYYKMAKRNLYVDKYYVDRIFSRGENNRGT